MSGCGEGCGWRPQLYVRSSQSLLASVPEKRKHLTEGLPDKRRKQLQEMPKSTIVSTMITQLGTGMTRLGPVHDLSCAIVNECVTPEALQAFSSLGGPCGTNVERDLHRWLGNYNNFNVGLSE